MTFVVSHTLAHGVREGVKVSLTPLITDFPIIISSLIFLEQVANMNYFLMGYLLRATFCCIVDEWEKLISLHQLPEWTIHAIWLSSTISSPTKTHAGSILNGSGGRRDLFAGAAVNLVNLGMQDGMFIYVAGAARKDD